MSSDAWGMLVLGLYAAAAMAAVAWDCLRCVDGWRVWVLHLIIRSYTPLVFSVRIQGKCPFPREGPALVIANHRSPVDPLFVASGSQEKREGHFVRVIEFLTAREYCELGGFVGWICRAARSIPVGRDGRDMGPAKEALRRLRAGRLVGIFPEGRINLGDGLLPGNTGVAWLALRSEVPVFPVFVHGAPLGTSMVAPFVTPTRVKVTYGESIDLSAYYGRKPTPALLAEVTDLLMEHLAALGHVKARKCSVSPDATGGIPALEAG